MQFLKYKTKSRYSFVTAFCLSCALLLGGCASASAPIDPAHFELPDKPLTWDRFAVCHGYGCALHSAASYTKTEWQNITSILKPAAKSAEQERHNIATAIATMEKISGEKTGTKTDVAEASFTMIDQKQQDCIDETLNTDMYLGFLEKENLLVWHKVDESVRRGFFIDGEWPHNTAVIKEKETGQLYTVDSWFFKNGEPPVIVPIEKWLTGWRPEHDS